MYKQTINIAIKLRASHVGRRSGLCGRQLARSFVGGSRKKMRSIAPSERKMDSAVCAEIRAAVKPNSSPGVKVSPVTSSKRVMTSGGIDALVRKRLD